MTDYGECGILALMQETKLTKEDLDKISELNDSADRELGIDLGDTAMEDALEKAAAEFEAQNQPEPKTIEEIREVAEDQETNFGADFKTPDLFVQREMQVLDLGFVDNKVCGLEVRFTLRAHLDDAVGPNIKLADTLSLMVNRAGHRGASPANCDEQVLSLIAHGQVPDSVAKLVMFPNEDFQQFDCTLRFWASIDIIEEISDDFQDLFAKSTALALKGVSVDEEE